MKEEFKQYSSAGKAYNVDGDKYTYPNCTTPWHQSMLGMSKYNDSDVEVCNEDDSYTLYRLDYLFLEKATQMVNMCKGRLFNYHVQNIRDEPLSRPLNMYV